PRIKLPRDLFTDRANSRGIDLTDPLRLTELSKALAAASAQPWSAAPLIAGKEAAGSSRSVTDPADRRRTVGMVTEASAAQSERGLAVAAKAAPDWDAVPAPERAQRLERAADLIEAQMPRFIAMIVREGGRTIPDALAEVREAVDHCRYD